MRLLYNEKEFTLEELLQDEKEFREGIKKYLFLIEDNFSRTLPLDKDYHVALSFFDQLFNQIKSAEFALLKGYKKLHSSTELGWESGEIGQFWLRFQYLKNSIIWYDSTQDLILQTLWFGFGLYRKKSFNGKTPILNIDSRETFEFLLKRCSFKSVEESLKAINTSESKVLIQLLEPFYKNSIRRKVNNWANNLKHHGALAVNEIYRRGVKFRSGKFDSDYILPEIINIDDIPIVLKAFHNEFVGLALEIYNFFNFRGMYEIDSNGRIRFDRIKAETEFKKIITK